MGGVERARKDGKRGISERDTVAGRAISVNCLLGADEQTGSR